LESKENADGILIDNDFAQQFDLDYYMKLVSVHEGNFSSYFQGIKENDFCFCGSAKIYKDCCLKITTGYNTR
jgi:uncharacterized protein YecA (UPF0149 family)